MPTTIENLETSPVTKHKGRFRLIGYRCIVEILKEEALRDSWLWTPSASHKFRAARVIQTGSYTPSRKRPPLEFKTGQRVIIDGNYGSQEIVDGDRKFLVVSAHDVAGILE